MTAAENSMGIELLADTDPIWVERLRRGTAWMRSGLLISLGSAATSFVLTVLVLVAADVGITHGRLARSATIVGLLSWAGFGVYGVGLWFVTTGAAGQPERLPSFVRLATGLTVAAGVARWLPTDRWSPQGWAVYLVITSGVQAVGVVGLWATLALLSGLARRLPDDRLAGRADTIMYGLGTPLAMGWLLRVLTLVPWFTGGRPLVADRAVPVASSVCGLVLLGFAVAYAGLLTHLTRRIAAVAVRPRPAADPSLAPPPAGP